MPCRVEPRTLLPTIRTLVALLALMPSDKAAAAVP
jgi:hypothetical protein